VARFVLISFGGALGTGARYLLSTRVAQAYGAGFPRGTLIINVSGSFVIALVMQLALVTGAVPENTRLFLTTGMMGGYTTYSTFNYETLSLASRGAYGLAALNLGLTVAGALVAGFLGLVAAQGIALVGAKLAG